MLKRLVSIFVQGLVTILPLAVTILILVWLGAAAEHTFSMVFKRILPDQWYVTGMGVVCGVIFVFVIGLLVNVWGVPQLIRLGEQIISRIPLVKTIYGAVHDLLGFFSKSSGLGGGKVVMVSIGNTGMKVIGLLTRDRFDDLPAGLGSDDCVAVYIPFSYQIGGLTLFVPRDRVEPLDMRIQDAMRFIVTAGAKRTDDA